VLGSLTKLSEQLLYVI